MEHERQARLEAVLQTAVDAIITIDEMGKIEDLNPATERLFGYSANEMVGENVNLLMPSPYHEEHDGYLRRYRETGKRKIIGVGREVLGRRKDGTTFPMHLAVSEFYSGQRRLFTGIVRDISEIKSAEQELKRLNEDLEARVRERTRELREAQEELIRKERMATLGQVSGGIAHEIRNPLNAVKTSCYFLLNAQNPSKEKIEEHLERIDRQVTLIDNVITALSDVARMPEPNRTPQRLEDHIRHILDSVSLSDNIHVELKIPAGLPEILADENQFQIVFRNLIRNARDAMQNQGGTLVIGAEIVGTNVRVYVQDSGVGMAEDVQARIAEPLFSTKARGMGLGLAISKAIVDKNGGRMDVKSTLGEGSCFSVYLNAAVSNKQDDA